MTMTYLAYHNCRKIEAKTKAFSGFSTLDITCTDSKGAELEFTLYAGTGDITALAQIAQGINQARFGHPNLEDTEGEAA